MHIAAGRILILAAISHRFINMLRTDCFCYCRKYSAPRFIGCLTHMNLIAFKSRAG